MDETRQSPEQILKQIEKEQQRFNRGHLKIFFGYAAGVGKTYAMLKAAHSAAEVVKVEYFAEDDVPLPLDRTKHIIRKCTDEDFDPPEVNQE